MAAMDLRSLLEDVAGLIQGTRRAAEPEIARARRAVEDSLEDLRNAMREHRTAPRRSAAVGRWITLGAITVLAGVAIGALATRRPQLRKGDHSETGAGTSLRG